MIKLNPNANLNNTGQQSKAMRRQSSTSISFWCLMKNNEATSRFRGFSHFSSLLIANGGCLVYNFTWVFPKNFCFSLPFSCAPTPTQASFLG